MYNPYIAVNTAECDRKGFNSSYHTKLPSFKGDIMNIGGDIAKYTNVTNKINAIEEILGKKGYISNIIRKARLSTKDDTLIIRKSSVFEDIISTLKYPFMEMPFQILNVLSKGLKKIGFADLGNKITGFPLVKDRIQKLEIKKSEKFLGDIFESFCKKGVEDVDVLKKGFVGDLAGKILKTAKNYDSRDERTLNRFVTGSIGAMLSSVDMYNISMLEKNDKTAAKKAQKDRREQEMQRILISSGLTFFSLGALSKITRNSVFANALVIAGSTLIAEVFARVRKHKSLIPLTPEQAAKIARKNKNLDLDTSFSSVKLSMRRINKSDKAKLYKNFTNITYTQKNDTDKKEKENQVKKNNHLFAKIGIASVVACIIYFASNASKGKYAKLKQLGELYRDHKEVVDSAIKAKKGELPDDLIQKIKKIIKIKTKFNFPEFFKEEIKSRIVNGRKPIDIQKMNQELEELLKSKEAQDIAPIIKEYQTILDIIRKAHKGNTYKGKVERTVISAIYAGITKLIKTFYTILSAPAFLYDKMRFKNSEKIIKKFGSKFIDNDNSKKLKDYEEQISALYKLLKKFQNKEDKYGKIAKEIRNRAYNFQKGADTSELANLSRTLVTFISSYFYVNDFRNTVLIESEGKNKQRAKEVMKDSIGFKTFNLFFNGTIMNLGNSLFNKVLNNSLLGATLVAAGEEVTNEFLIRKTISRPMKKMASRESILEYDKQRTNKKGPMGAWTRFFKKLTGQKSLVEKYESQQAKKNNK